MTKEEFDKLGITDRDLVSINYEGTMCVYKLVGSIKVSSKYHFILSPGPSSYCYEQMLRNFNCIYDLEIIKKDFWK